MRRPTAGPAAAPAVVAVVAALGALGSLGACGGGPPPAPPPTPAPPPPPAPARAAAGDTVYLLEHTVRADRRAQFEHFLADSYWPAVRRLARTDSAAARVLRQTRVLAPLRANGDGTFTYVIVTDPVVRGEAYNFAETLRRVYPPREAERRYRELRDSWVPAAGEFVARAFVQGAEVGPGPAAAGGAPNATSAPNATNATNAANAANAPTAPGARTSPPAGRPPR